MEFKNRLLILEDDKEFFESLILELKERGFSPYGGDSWKAIEKDLLPSTDFALVDLRLNQDSGLALIQDLKAANPHMRVVMFTGYGTIATAVEAMMSGAAHYLTKPVNIDEIVDALLDVPLEEDDDQDDQEIDTRRVSLARHEREYIEYVLAQCNGNITHAARWLGIRRQSLQRKLKKYPPSQ